MLVFLLLVYRDAELIRTAAGGLMLRLGLHPVSSASERDLCVLLVKTHSDGTT